MIPPGMRVAELPGIAAEQEPDGACPGDDHEDDLEQVWGSVARHEAAADDPQDHGQGPGLEDAHIDRAFSLMRPERADRGRDDDRQGRADRERHADILGHALQSEQLVEHRHDDRAAADAEYARQHAGHCTGRKQSHHQSDELAHRKFLKKHRGQPCGGRASGRTGEQDLSSCRRPETADSGRKVQRAEVCCNSTAPASLKAGAKSECGRKA